MSAERRRATRYRVTAPVHFDGGGSGTTHDISTSGLFFETDQHLAIGNTIRFAVDFADAPMRSEGNVVRVEKLNSKFGVAVELSSYVFQ